MKSRSNRYIKNAISRTVRTPAEGRNDDIFEIEETLNKKQELLPSYANYIPYDHFKVISSEVKECPKCCGNGVINIGTFTIWSVYYMAHMYNLYDMAI